MFNFKGLIIALVFSVSLINEAYSIMIDVRTKQEWDNGHIEGAIHIPLKNFKKQNKKIFMIEALLILLALAFLTIDINRIFFAEGISLIGH